jgi:hypothetical protein
MQYSIDRFGIGNRTVDLYNSYAEAPTSTYFYNEFTIVIWFKKSYQNMFSTFALFDFSFDNSRNIGLGIIKNEIIFFAKNSTGSIIKFESNYKIDYKEWYHIAITYSTNSKLIYLYINGVLFSSIHVDLILGETNLNYIGKSETLKIYFSTVRIDEIKIYNRELNSNEIENDSKDKSRTTTNPVTTPTTTKKNTARTTTASTIYEKCKYYSCSNGGICYIDNNGHAKCNCLDNYYGTNCESWLFFCLNFSRALAIRAF